LVDTTTGESFKKDRISDLKEQYMNLARVDAITSEFVSVGALFYSLAASNIYGGDPEIFLHDYGIDMLPDNYGLFMKQLDARATSVGRYRIGCNKTITPEPIFGRYARSFQSATGRVRMVFDLEDSLRSYARVKKC
jgi:hypothetical protein